MWPLKNITNLSLLRNPVCTPIYSSHRFIAHQLEFLDDADHLWSCFAVQNLQSLLYTLYKSMSFVDGREVVKVYLFVQT